MGRRYIVKHHPVETTDDTLKMRISINWESDRYPHWYKNLPLKHKIKYHWNNFKKYVVIIIKIFYDYR